MSPNKFKFSIKEYDVTRKKIFRGKTFNKTKL